MTNLPQKERARTAVALQGNLNIGRRVKINPSLKLFPTITSYTEKKLPRMPTFLRSKPRIKKQNYKLTFLIIVIIQTLAKHELVKFNSTVKGLYAISKWDLYSECNDVLIYDIQPM